MQRRASLSIAVQGAALKGRFPDSELRMRGMTLTWTAELRPTALSCEYTIRLTYAPDGYPPRVEVLPELASRPGEPLPHVYADGSLCLHVPGEWSPKMFIADTIVPWACEWLLHYEIWLATGEWHGGGEHPSAGTPGGNSNGSRRDRRARRQRSRRRERRPPGETAEAPDV